MKIKCMTKKIKHTVLTSRDSSFTAAEYKIHFVGYTKNKLDDSNNYKNKAYCTP